MDKNQHIQETGPITYSVKMAKHVDVGRQKCCKCGTNETYINEVCGVCKQEAYRETDRPNNTHTQIYYQFQDIEIRNVKEEEKMIGANGPMAKM